MEQEDFRYIIKVSDLLNRSYQVDKVELQPEQGDKVEVQPKDTAALYMHNVYRQALQLVRSIIKPKSDRKDSEVNNIIAFTGRRGTGKTSAMLSFAQYLGDSRKHENELKDASFFVLPHITASMFRKQDHLLRSVLAGLAAELDNDETNSPRTGSLREQEMRRKEIRKQLVKLLQDYKATDGSFDELNNADAELSAQTSGLRIRQQLEKVIRQFLEYRLEKRDTDKRFLVICVDDIDMAVDNQSRIISDMEQYFKTGNVIILLTANFRNLKLAMRRTFFNSLISDKSSADCITECERASEAQTNDYFLKLIPSDMQITMPSWRKADYRELTPFVIDTTDYDKQERLQNCAVLPEKLLSPKGFLMFLLARRTGIYLDAAGSAPHFIEPDSLRDLHDRFLLFYHMEPIYTKEEPDTPLLPALTGNRKIMLDYLYFNMKPNMQFRDEIEQHFADRLETIPVERRGLEVWRYYYTRFQEEKEAERIKRVYGEHFYYDELLLYQEKYYSFGEMFRVLYTASGIGLFSEELVNFILASFSFALPNYVEKRERILIDYKNKKKNITFHNTEKAYEELRTLFSSSMLGTWYKRARIHAATPSKIIQTAFNDASFQNAHIDTINIVQEHNSSSKQTEPHFFKETRPEDIEIVAQLPDEFKSIMWVQYWCQGLLSTKTPNCIITHGIKQHIRRAIDFCKKICSGNYREFPTTKDEIQNIVSDLRTLHSLISSASNLQLTDTVTSSLQRLTKSQLIQEISMFVSILVLLSDTPFSSAMNGNYDYLSIDPARLTWTLLEFLDINPLSTFYGFSPSYSFILHTIFPDIIQPLSKIPASFLWKHPDIIYHIYKKTLISTIYNSDTNPAGLRPVEPYDDVAEPYLISFFCNFANELATLNRIYNSSEIAQLSQWFQSIETSFKLFSSGKLAPPFDHIIYWRNKKDEEAKRTPETPPTETPKEEAPSEPTKTTKRPARKKRTPKKAEEPSPTPPAEDTGNTE